MININIYFWMDYSGVFIILFYESFVDVNFELLKFFVFFFVLEYGGL